MSAKLIFSDIDGTLINNELKVTPKTRDAIRHQIINGNIFIPASARLPKGIMTAVGQILKVFPMIAYNGALALDETGRALITRFLKQRKLQKFAVMLKSKITVLLGIFIAAMCGIVQKKKATGSKKKKALLM